MAWAIVPGLLERKAASKGLSLAELFRRAEVSKPVRAKVRRGERISPGVLLRINAVLSTTPTLIEIDGLLADEPQESDTVNGSEPLTVTKEAKVGDAIRRSQA